MFRLPNSLLPYRFLSRNDIRNAEQFVEVREGQYTPELNLAQSMLLTKFHLISVNTPTGAVPTTE
jgi:hypothetical protein